MVKVTKSEAIVLLNLMLEPGQERNNEALQIAVRAIREQMSNRGGDND